MWQDNSFHRIILTEHTIVKRSCDIWDKLEEQRHLQGSPALLSPMSTNAACCMLLSLFMLQCLSDAACCHSVTPLAPCSAISLCLVTTEMSTLNLWLVESDHVTWILAFHWTTVTTETSTLNPDTRHAVMIRWCNDGVNVTHCTDKQSPAEVRLWKTLPWLSLSTSSSLC